MRLFSLIVALAACPVFAQAPPAHLAPGTAYVVYRDAQGKVLWAGIEAVGSAPLAYSATPQSTPAIVAVPLADCSRSASRGGCVGGNCSTERGLPVPRFLPTLPYR